MFNKLPDDSFRTNLIYKNSFNSNLISGLQQGLTLYNPEDDIKLYNYIDTNPLENINFNTINNELNGQTFIDKGKSLIDGIVQQLNVVGDKTKDNFDNMFNINIIPVEYKIFGGLFLLFLILNRK